MNTYQSSVQLSTQIRVLCDRALDGSATNEDAEAYLGMATGYATELASRACSVSGDATAFSRDPIEAARNAARVARLTSEAWRQVADLAHRLAA